MIYHKLQTNKRLLGFGSFNKAGLHWGGTEGAIIFTGAAALSPSFEPPLCLLNSVVCTVSRFGL